MTIGKLVVGVAGGVLLAVAVIAVVWGIVAGLRDAMRLIDEIEPAPASASAEPEPDPWCLANERDLHQRVRTATRTWTRFDAARRRTLEWRLGRYADASGACDREQVQYWHRQILRHVRPAAVIIDEGR